jgi:hypothetical protein
MFDVTMETSLVAHMPSRMMAARLSSGCASGSTPVKYSLAHNKQVFRIRDILVRILMRIQMVEKNTDPTDPDPDADPEHCNEQIGKTEKQHISAKKQNKL